MYCVPSVRDLQPQSIPTIGVVVLKETHSFGAEVLYAPC